MWSSVVWCDVTWCDKMWHEMGWRYIVQYNKCDTKSERRLRSPHITQPLVFLHITTSTIYKVRYKTIRHIKHSLLPSSSSSSSDPADRDDLSLTWKGASAYLKVVSSPPLSKLLLTDKGKKNEVHSSRVFRPLLLQGDRDRKKRRLEYK